MRLTPSDLAREAAATGFRQESLEKVILLLELLDAVASHPFLQDRMALKGGTALNLFVFDAPRLSVDIDLNYVGVADREHMVADRPKIEQAIQAVCGRAGIQSRHMPQEHAGGKWRLSYRGAGGATGSLELDVNFMLRTPLWPVRRIDSRAVGSFVAKNIPVLDIHELAAGKLAALLARTASRDLFDTSQLLHFGSLDPAKLRIAFVVYGGVNRKDWRTVSIEDIDAAAAADDVGQMLLPLLRAAPSRDNVRGWMRAIVSDCRELLSMVLPLSADEREFLALLNDRGEIASELVTDDERLQSVIRAHPGLLWKALNVRRHRGVGGNPLAAD